MLKKPFEGIKIVDFGWSLVGPLMAKDLAEYGALVINIESKTRPGLFRGMGYFKDNIVGPNRSGVFNQMNVSKLGVTINLATPKGKELAKKLVAWSDIVVENFSGGAMEKMGLGYDELRKVKPDIIMARCSFMGQTGPWANAQLYGDQGVPLSGFSRIVGWPDRETEGSPGGGPDTDHIGPRFCFPAMIAALLYRQRTGKGQCIDVAQYETGAHFLAPLAMDYVVNHRVAKRKGNRCDYAAPHNVYRCLGDFRWCAIAVFTDEEWQNFCKVIGNPPWVHDLKFSTLLAKKENEDELDELVEAWTLNHSAEEVMQLMQSAGVSAGVVQNGQDLMERDPQLKHRHFFWELDHPEVGKYRAFGASFLLSNSSHEIKSAPLMGEHNEYVLKEILGISDTEIAEMVIEGVIE